MASKLEVVETLRVGVASLKIQSQTNQPSASNTIDPRDKGRQKTDQSNREQQCDNWLSDDYDGAQPWWKRNPVHRPYTKIEFLKFDGGDPCRWILKEKKYFRYYQILKELKVDIVMIYLKGDALDLFSWLNSEQGILY
ncbi:hypothetical protein GOBAR_AA10823 [Gossypium barbadense]|uniref:Uncharacterized protein n=1 Tax=Gossypium barbadense TaxID=3634 RepID=A0A2P5Y2J5_GOSBA|nr:hypothetical protein GOBAR_AA10823 [Gossypium barbadense]